MNLTRRTLLGSLVAVLALIANAPARPALAAGPDLIFPIPPCRAVDTRVVGGPIPNSGSRGFDVVGTLANQGGQSTCGIPSNAQAVFLNIVAVSPTAAGYLTVYPYPGPLPATSTLNFVAGQNLANGALSPICDPTSTTCSSDIVVSMGGGASANIVIDITGYIAPASGTSP